MEEVLMPVRRSMGSIALAALFGMISAALALRRVSLDLEYFAPNPKP
jgi:hypothetical protein